MKRQTSIAAARRRDPPAQEAEELLAENQRLREEMRREAAGWEKAFNAIADGILIQDANLNILRANEAMGKMVGEKANKLAGKKCYEAFHRGTDPPPGCPFLEALRTKETVLKEIEEPSAGRVLEEVLEPLLSGDGEVVGMVHTVRDLTEKRRAEDEFRKMHQGIVEANLNLQAAMQQLKNTQAQLIHSEKMAAIGQLVSGVAHELNNPLAGVLGYAELLLGQELDETARTGLEKVHKEAQRAAKIVQNLLSFARKHKPEKTLVQVNDLLSNVLELRAYEFKVNNISLETRLDPSLPLTMADGYQLQQVFLNIITNAEQALLAEGKEGAISIATSLVGADRPSRLGRSGTEPSAPTSPHQPQEPDTIRIEITDNGPGIPQEHLDRIFDPFFTTKPVGQGTGLGLSICYGIIEEHGGAIAVTSSPGGAERGTCFLLELPVARVSEQKAGTDD